jgi:hypothetical protein
LVKILDEKIFFDATDITIYFSAPIRIFCKLLPFPPSFITSKKIKSMKQVKFFATVFVAAGMLFLNSCNSGEEKKSETTGSDSSVVSPDSSAVKEETPAVTAAAGPMSIMTIKHKVANYSKWKPSYESRDSIRLAYGLHNYVIARGIDDSNMVMVALRMDDVNRAKELAASQGMKDRMKKAGVVGPVSIDYLESVMNDSTAIQQTVRLMVKSKVKDWDAWKKSFDSHKQTRIDSGLTDRVVSYTVGNNHNVTLVFAVADVAKAKAFIKSKDLKDKMAEAGVVGPPSFFFYRITAKY